MSIKSHEVVCSYLADAFRSSFTLPGNSHNEQKNQRIDQMH